MYNKNKERKETQSAFKREEKIEGETIEEKVRRITTTKEPITDGAQLTYTERKDGVAPEYDIRTDRFEIAVEAMDKANKSKAAKREAKVVEMKPKTAENKDGKTEPIQATDKQG